MVSLYIRKMGEAKLRIVYFQQDGLITGSAISLRHFLSALNREEFEPIVVLAKEGKARSLYESLGIKVLVHPFDTFWTFPGPGCLSRGMLNQLKALIPNHKLRHFIEFELKPDLIHINDKASLNVGVSVGKTRIPIVQHSRSSYYSTACKLGKYLSAKTIKKYTQHLICISEDEEDGFETFKNKTTIYNTVDFSLVNEAKEKSLATRTNLRIEKDEYLIGYAAHVSEKKGVWDFLDLCRTLKEDNRLKFIIVGQLDNNGPTYLGNGKFSPLSPKNYIEEFARVNQLGDRLLLTGFRNDNLNLIAAMDLLVVPNKNGVLGRQPIEAQALGVPVVARKGHSNKSNIIKDGETGYLVDNIEGAIATIKNIINQNNFKTISKAASEYAEQQFNPVTNIKKIERIYRSLLKQ